MLSWKIRTPSLMLRLLIRTRPPSFQAIRFVCSSMCVLMLLGYASSMKDERLRIPIDPYLHALDLATIHLARLEWSAVWCCEKITPGYITTVSDKLLGALLLTLRRRAPATLSPAIGSSLFQAASDVKAMVRHRNDLVHSNPGTAEYGEQRVLRRGSEWIISAVMTFRMSLQRSLTA